jgi:hypothetical protein
MNKLVVNSQIREAFAHAVAPLNRDPGNKVKKWIVAALRTNKGRIFMRPWTASKRGPKRRRK